MSFALSRPGVKSVLYVDDLNIALKEYNARKQKNTQGYQYFVMENVICEAMEQNTRLSFVYFKDHNYHLIIGYVHFLDNVTQEIRIVDYFNEVHIIKIRQLIDVRQN